MRTMLISCVAGAALLGAISGALAMATGSGGGGGYGGGGMGPDNPGPSEYTIAVRLIKHDKCGEALSHLQIAQSQKPNNADILNYLGYCERKIGNFQFSLDYYNKALAIEPEHRGVHEYLGELYLAMNKIDDANKELATLTSLCPRGCDEKDVLTKAIADWNTTQLNAPTPAPASAPAPAPTQQ